MKTIICLTILLFTFTTITFAQSVLDYQTGTGVEIQSGADVCADDVIINGTFIGGGTVCGAAAYGLNLTAILQGFYNPSTNFMIPDTATVYLRNATFPYAIIEFSKSLLSPSGIGTFIFNNAVNGTNYYIVLRHRNSIETWSSGGNAFVSGSLAYNFTTAASTAYGNNQIQVDITPVKFAIYSGDVNQDGIVDGTDAAIVDNAAFNFVTGYVNPDVNGDEIVDGSDAAIVDNNAFNFVSKITP